MSSALKQAESIVDSLEPGERVEFLQYISPRIGRSPSVQQTPDGSPDAAWEAFRALARPIEKLSARDVGHRYGKRHEAMMFMVDD